MPLPPDELSALTDAALSAETPDGCCGCTNAELRVRALRHPPPRESAHTTRAARARWPGTEFGMGVRVVVDGAVGFAATVDVQPAEAADLVRGAIETARVTARASRRAGRRLAASPSHGEVKTRTQLVLARSIRRTVTLADKVDAASRVEAVACSGHGMAPHVTAEGAQRGRGQPYLADLGGTARDPQRRVGLHPLLEALALGEAGFE